MALATLESIMVGAQVRVAYDGAAIASGDQAAVIRATGDTTTSVASVSRGALPGVAAAVWQSLGIIKKPEWNPGNQTPIEIDAPMPGTIGPWEILRAAQKPVLTLTLSQVNYLTVQMLFGTLALSTSSAQANPLEGAGQIYCWVKLQVYRQKTNTLWLSGDTFGEIILKDSIDLDPKKAVEATFEIRLLHSALNSLGLGV